MNTTIHQPNHTDVRYHGATTETAPASAGNTPEGLTTTDYLGVEMAEAQSTHRSTPHALYRFWDADRHLLYVGITVNPGARWKNHTKDKAWWLDVAHVTIEQHPTRQAVLDAERTAILTERPRHNVVHNQGTDQAAPGGPTPPSVDPELVARIKAQQASREASRQDYVDAFFDTWPRYRHDRLPANIDTAVASYSDVGLPLDDMLDAVRTAVTTPGIYNRAAYFRAICRNRLDEIEEAARG